MHKNVNERAKTSWGIEHDGQEVDYQVKNCLMHYQINDRLKTGVP